MPLAEALMSLFKTPCIAIYNLAWCSDFEDNFTAAETKKLLRGIVADPTTSERAKLHAKYAINKLNGVL